ncbi:MAG: hypothetical protein QOE34_1609, partial [Verrucomicrobiota bacterium]
VRFDIVDGFRFVDREALFGWRFHSTVGSLVVCATRDDTQELPLSVEFRARIVI